MSDKKQMSDKQAFETFVRSGQRKNKIAWTPTGDKEDTDALNRAIRRAAGKDAPEPGDQPFPWTSLKDGAGDESEGT